MKRTLTILLAFVGLNLNLLHAQSDEPCGATALTVSTSCTGATGIAGLLNPPSFTNSTSASAGVTLPTLSCNGFSTTTFDFWFTAVVPASGSVSVTLTAGDNATITPSDFWDMALYSSSSNTCAGSTFTQLATSCVATAPPSLKVTGQTPGSTIYVRLWREASYVQTVARSYFLAAVDGGIAAPACPTYVSPTTGTTGFADVEFVWSQASNAASYDFYLGTSAATAVSLGTFDKGTFTNDTLYVPYAFESSGALSYVLPPNSTRFWYIAPRNCAAAAANCLVNAQSFTTGGAPTNDNCSSAFTILPGNIYTAPSAYATQSQAATTCTSEYAADVWFKFTTNAAGGAASIEAASFGFTDVEIEVFSGTCGTLTAIDCVDDFGSTSDEQLDLVGLLPNTTYYVRLYTYLLADDPLWSDGYIIRLTGAAVIPVELTKFDGKAKATANVLTWETATERNASHFLVERSADGEKDFKAIGTVKAFGTTNAIQNYTFIDQQPLSNGYYRLKTVDFDGKDGVSKTISIERKSQKLVLNKVFPTPASDIVTIQFDAPSSETVKLTITDFLGRVVEQKTIDNTEGSNLLPVNVAQLPVGAYFIQLVANGEQVKGKFIKN